MSDEMLTKGMGWMRDLPDFRDLTVNSENVPSRVKRAGREDSVKDLLTAAGAAKTPKRLSKHVDLRQWCSPIVDQGNLGSCTANAGAGLYEYFENKAYGTYTRVSRLFLYKVTRNLMHAKGDTGAYLRTMMGALVLFGTPPEEYWDYQAASFEDEPGAFCYAFAQTFQALEYYRLDPPATATDELLTRIKTNLNACLPSVFGFSVFSSISQAAKTGKIPFPLKSEKIMSGHAIMAVGYDDTIEVENSSPGATPTVGALLIRNSWGTDWGMEGYAWLPYEYVLQGLAVDWWSLIKGEWVDTKQFR